MTSENKNRAECDKPKGIFSIFFMCFKVILQENIYKCMKSISSSRSNLLIYLNSFQDFCGGKKITVLMKG